jgi:hypothetical protein
VTGFHASHWQLSSVTGCVIQASAGRRHPAALSPHDAPGASRADTYAPEASCPGVSRRVRQEENVRRLASVARRREWRPLLLTFSVSREFSSRITRSTQKTPARVILSDRNSSIGQAQVCSHSPARLSVFACTTQCCKLHQKSDGKWPRLLAAARHVWPSLTLAACLFRLGPATSPH